MRRREEMIAVPRFAASVVADLIRRQPMSPGKVGLAWQMAAGPTLARAAAVEFEPPATIRLRPKDPRWAAELERSREVLSERLQTVLGIPKLALTIAEPCPSTSLGAPRAPRGINPKP